MEETELLVDAFDQASGREGESLFARGEDDALMRYVKPTKSDFNTMVKLVIDGEVVEVPKATEMKDSQGNTVYDENDEPIPRYTTIYDAAMTLAEKSERVDRREMQRRIPILCHQEHLNPIAVCRMCSVQVSKPKRGKFTADRKLAPACQQRVEDKMAVFTRHRPADPADPTKLDPAYVASIQRALTDEFGIEPKDLPDAKKIQEYLDTVGEATKFIAELLVADHLRKDAVTDPRFRNELAHVATEVGLKGVTRCSSREHGPTGRNFVLHPNSRPRAEAPEGRGRRAKKDAPTDIPAHLPYSSRSFQVDHDRCIQCDRCARSCSDVKPFKVIGHTGKGYNARISFDLDEVMNKSNCVQCGECMTSCPTGAISLNRRVVPKPLWEHFKTNDPDHKDIVRLRNPMEKLPEGFLSAEEMREVVLYHDEAGRREPFYPFRDIPLSYLKWNEGAVRRIKLDGGRRKKGGFDPRDAFITEGEYATTAFLLEKGKFYGEQAKEQGGFPLDAERDLILGEIACLTNGPRTATVWADGPASVLEVSRNMVEMMQRSPSARDRLDRVYKRRAMRACLIDSHLFKGLSSLARKLIVAAFQQQAKVRQLYAGQVIVKENTRVGPDEKGVFRGDFFVIFQGFVKISHSRDGHEHVLNYLGQNKHFGEIALQYDHPTVVAACKQAGVAPQVRTATVTALGDLEVIQVDGVAFRQYFQGKNLDFVRAQLPGLIKAAWLKESDTAKYDLKGRGQTALDEIARDVAAEYRAIGDSIARLSADILEENLRRASTSTDQNVDLKSEFVRQGLYQGQKMLVLDLLTCTRCDECTKACADAHGDGTSRLLREGLRFGDFLVAASCRSCYQPYCMEGCPVDAIHREGGSLEIRIEKHCIGCSLCERSCPYGSIQMVPHPDKYPGMRWKDLLPDVETTGPTKMAQYQRKAVNCDLCQHEAIRRGSDPYCVKACPHKAAFRWSGDELLAEVKRREG